MGNPPVPDNGIHPHFGRGGTRVDVVGVSYLADSRFHWLPLTFDDRDCPVMRWQNEWEPSERK